jgi:glutaredoxin
MNKNAIVFTQNACQGCATVKSILGVAGYSIEEIKLDNVDAKKKFFEHFPGARTVPQVVINGAPIGGLDAVKAFLN